MDILKKTSEITIGNQTYKINKLTLGDFAELDDWARKRIIARIPMKDFSAKSLSEIVKVKITEDNIMEEISSMSGVRESLRISLTKSYPGIDIDKVMGEIAIDDIAMITTALVGESSDSKNAGEPGAK